MLKGTSLQAITHLLNSMIVCTHVEYPVHSPLAALVTHTMSKWHSGSRNVY